MPPFRTNNKHGIKAPVSKPTAFYHIRLDTSHLWLTCNLLHIPFSTYANKLALKKSQANITLLLPSSDSRLLTIYTSVLTGSVRCDRASWLLKTTTSHISCKWGKLCLALVNLWELQIYLLMEKAHLSNLRGNGKVNKNSCHTHTGESLHHWSNPHLCLSPVHLHLTNRSDMTLQELYKYQYYPFIIIM